MSNKKSLSNSDLEHYIDHSTTYEGGGAEANDEKKVS